MHTRFGASIRFRPSHHLTFSHQHVPPEMHIYIYNTHTHDRTRGQSKREEMKPQLRRSSRLKPIPIESQESIPTRKNTSLRPINPGRREETPMTRIKRKNGPISQPRPRWTFRPAPPEAYLIIRAHRRPAGGWGEVWNWSKKRDEWYVLPIYKAHRNRIYELSSNDFGSGSAVSLFPVLYTKF